MRTTPNVELIYNRRHTATTTKEAAVELRVSFRKQQKYMATGIKLLPKLADNMISIADPAITTH